LVSDGGRPLVLGEALPSPLHLLFPRSLALLLSPLPLQLMLFGILGPRFDVREHVAQLVFNGCSDAVGPESAAGVLGWQDHSEDAVLLANADRERVALHRDAESGIARPIVEVDAVASSLSFGDQRLQDPKRTAEARSRHVEGHRVVG